MGRLLGEGFSLIQCGLVGRREKELTYSDTRGRTSVRSLFEQEGARHAVTGDVR